MNRDIDIKGIHFHISNYTPRRNTFERGIKYKLFVDYIPTEYHFSTIKECKSWIEKNYYIFM